MSDTNSKWTRMAKAASALRGDRLSLVLTDEGWQATYKGAVHRIQAPPIGDALEEAISVTDISLVPAGWTYSAGNWMRDGWMIAPQGAGWNIYKHTSDSKERASVRDFTSADRARRWVEVRLDRTGTNLRGPKPRAGRKSNCKLPDVRVTESEKVAAMTRLKALGLTYSQFVRASLRFADEHLADECGHWQVQTIDGRAAFIREPNLRGPERSEGLMPNGSVESDTLTGFYPDDVAGFPKEPTPSTLPAWATRGLGGISPVMIPKVTTDG